MRRPAIVAAMLTMILAACGGATSSAPPAPSASSAAVGSASPVTASPSQATESAAPASSASPAPTPAFPATGVTIVNEGESQFELWSPGRQRILVDIADPTLLTSPATAADVLLTTHFHQDHFKQTFLDGFPGKMLTAQQGSLTAGDVKIRSIAASHMPNDAITPVGASDYIFVIDIGGLRVVVFGDLGQDALTAGQMNAIGAVDVAMSQLDNGMSMMSADNRKAIAQMNQVRPRVLIPTHDSVEGAKMAASAWPTATAAGTWVTITRDRLPATLTVLFMGDSAPAFRKILGITSPAW